jgi:hypothetical protein
VRSGPEGAEDRLTPGDRARVRNLAVRLDSDTAFRAGGADVLPAGQFVAGTVLTDRQQRRQRLFREFLKRPPLGPQDARPVLLAWADPLDPHFTLGTPAARTVGSALVVVPVRLERPAGRQPVTIPGPLIAYRRVLDDRSLPPKLSGKATDEHLRFQLPEAVLPFHVQSARLALQLTAPGREVTIAARTANGLTELRRVTGPTDPVRVDITDERLLRLDAAGGLHLNLAVGEQPGTADLRHNEEEWNMEYLELEVTGRSE